MVVDANYSNHYAQSGYMYRAGYNGCVKEWAEQAIQSAAVDYYYGGCVALGDTHSFWEQMVYTGSTYHIRSNVDNNIIRESTVNPFSYWKEPFGVQFEEETTYPQSTIGGSATAKLLMSAAQVQQLSDDSSVTIAGNAAVYGASDVSNWAHDSPSSTAYEMWEN